MLVGNHKTFVRDKSKLYNLLNLRIVGFSTTTLANLFNVSRRAVYFHLKRYFIEEPTEVYDIQRIIKPLLPQPPEDKWYEVDGERFNKGKSYDEYVRYSHIIKSKNNYT